MVGPGALLALGGLLGGLLGGGPGGARGAHEGTETPPDFEVEAGLLVVSEPQTPKCFSRTLHDLSCFWDAPGPPDPNRFRLQFRLEQDPWQDCPLWSTAVPPNSSRFWCSLPPSATVTFMPLDLRVLPGVPGPPGTPPATPGSPLATSGTPLYHRTLYIDQVVLPGPPQNVSAVPGGARGELCVRWAPPPGPYLESSLVFELALSPPGGPPKTVGVPAGRREQLVGGLGGSTPYTVRARARPDGLSYGGFWSPWSPPTTAKTPPDLDAVTLGLSCLLVVLLLGLGALGLLGHRRLLREKLWPPVPGPEREFEGLFSAYGGNFQLWLCQGVGAPWAPPGAPPEAEELSSAVEEVGGPLPGKGPPPTPEEEGEEGEEGPPPCAPPGAPPGGPSPSPSFEYTLFDPGSALLCPRGPPPGSPYANLGPPKAPPPPQSGPPKGRGAGDPPPLRTGPPYVICS